MRQYQVERVLVGFQLLGLVVLTHGFPVVLLKLCDLLIQGRYLRFEQSDSCLILSCRLSSEWLASVTLLNTL